MSDNKGQIQSFTTAFFLAGDAEIEKCHNIIGHEKGVNMIKKCIRLPYSRSTQVLSKVGFTVRPYNLFGPLIGHC